MDKRKILIVEDDSDINNLLSKILKKADYEVVQAFSGTEAHLQLNMEKPDLIMLDLMLPGMSGEALIDIVRREKNMNMPIIVISAKTSLDSKVKTMAMGADDYITKPFEPEEVIVRVQAAFRRYKGAWTEEETHMYSYKNLCLATDSRIVTLYGDEISLTNHEFDILQILVSVPQKVYSRECLYELVWKNGYYGEDNTVNVHVSNIRKKIAEKDPDEEYIKTVWGIGFKMA